MDRPQSQSSASSASPAAGSRPRAGDEKGLTGQLLRRVGLSVLGSNAEFWERSREEVNEAERQLEELRRQARLMAARCQGQLEIVAKEARAEEERQLISEKVGLELAAFREEMRRKELLEEERIRHLYRAVLTPGGEPAMGHRAVAYSLDSAPHPANYRADGTLIFPPLLYSEAWLQDSRSSSPHGDSQSPWLAAAAAKEKCRGTGRAVAFHDLEVPKPLCMAPRLARRSRPPLAPVAGSEMGEAEKLLRMNMARLERLERCGL